MTNMNLGTHPGTREAFNGVVIGRHPGTQQLVRYFAWAHLPEALQAVSAPFGLLALQLLDVLPDNAELTTALRKLLEAKDCAVRAALDSRVMTDGRQGQ
jgi:hypothetical protein